MAKKHNTKAKRGSRPRNSLPRATSETRARTAENVSALRIQRAVRGPNNKYINTLYNAISNAAFSPSAPLLVLLNGVANGTSENARIGRLTKNRWIDIDLDVYAGSSAQSTATDLSSSIRVYIVAETTALGSALAPAQFFLDAGTYTPTSQRDRSNRNASRYVVLWDSGPKMLALQPANLVLTVNPVAAPPVQDFSLHLPLEFQTDYSRGTTGTITDIDSNSLYLMIVTDTANMACTGGWTLCFNDDT